MTATLAAGTRPAATADLVSRALRAPQYATVRRGLLRRLLESLLFEGALAARPDGDGRWAVDGRDADGAPVSYAFAAARRAAFGRVRLGPGPVLRRAGGASAEAQSPTLLLDEVRDGLDADPQRLVGFARELEETLVKDALAQYVRARRGDRLAGADHDTLEWALTDGHPYHPAYKSRLGFDLDDQLAFGPEFARPQHPLWLAARRPVARVTAAAGLDPAAFLAGQLGRDTVAAFAERIRRAGGDPAGYALLPVHPWQWRERVGRAFAPQLRSGDLIVLGEDPHAHLAQQSIRTLACADVPDRAYLKLALSITNTSTERGLAAHTVANAAPISDWLHATVAGDDDLAGLVVLREVLGVAVDPPVPGPARGDVEGALACIWRESLHPHLRPGERAVPFPGLIARELDGTPLVDAWVRERGVRGWVRELAETAVVPLVHLLVAHGIALESHAQNMLLLHVQGRPSRIAVKDFHDGVRFSRAHLADPGRCPALAPTPAHHPNRNSFLETDDLGLVTDFLLDALLFVNLGELAALLQDAYGFAEDEFWAQVRAALAAHRRRRPDLAARFALFDVGRPELAVEQLTTRRLRPDTELRLHRVPNPLAGGR